MAKRKPKPLKWIAGAARYRDPDTGRFIARSEVRRVLDKVITESQKRVRETTERMRDGSIDVGDWDAVMRQEIKRTHLAAESLVRGGWKQMSPRDFGRVGQRVRAQYRFLDRFVRQIESGAVRTDGTLFNRALMYPGSARVGFHDSQTPQLEALGYGFERNVLHPAEHCEGCLVESRRGWQPIGTLRPIGSRDCRGNDKCSIAYRPAESS